MQASIGILNEHRHNKAILKTAKLRLGDSTQDVSGKVRIERLQKKLKELASHSTKLIPKSKNQVNVSPVYDAMSFPTYDEVLTTLNKTQNSLLNIEEFKHLQLKPPPQTLFRADGEIRSNRNESIEALRERAREARKKLNTFKDRLKTILKNYPKAVNSIKQQLLQLT